MKWGVRNKTTEKRLKMAIFKLLVLCYMHTTLHFFIRLCEKYKHVLSCVKKKKQENVWIYKYGFDTFKIVIFPTFQVRGCSC